MYNLFLDMYRYMFFGIKPFTARRARFHQKTRFGSLGTCLFSLLLWMLFCSTSFVELFVLSSDLVVVFLLVWSELFVLYVYLYWNGQNLFGHQLVGVYS